MKRDALEDVRAIWEKDFPDVPWIKGVLRIDPPRIEAGGMFQFVVEGGCASLCITPVGTAQVADTPAPVPSSAYSLAMAPDGSGIVLKVDPSWTVDHVLVQQAGDVPSAARVACLWLDSGAQEWEVIYNALDRHTALVKTIDSAILRRKLPCHDQLLAFVRHLLMGDSRKAIAVYEGSSRLREYRAGLQLVCERFELQLNAHGLKRTFRFWGPSEKKSYLEGTRDLMTSLASLSSHVCLGFGAVLGWVRDQDLIGHDDDLDILIAFDVADVPDLGSALELTRSALKAKGHAVVGTFFSHLWVKTTAGHNADVFVGLIEKDGSLSFYPSARRSLSLRDVAPVGRASLYGVSLPVPADCTSYLVRTYGATWREPDIGFAHPWDRAGYADIAGSRREPVMWTRGELAHRNRQAAMA